MTARIVTKRANLLGKGLTGSLGSEPVNTGTPNTNILTFTGTVADAQTVTIGTTVYEFDTTAAPGAITAGRKRVDVVAAQTAAAAATALTAAINANTASPVTAIDLSSAVLIYSKRAGDAALPCTKTATNAAWLSTSTYGKTAADPSYLTVVSRVPTAAEVTATKIYIVVPFWVKHAIVKVHTTATKDSIAWVGATTINEGAVSTVIIDNTGGVSWAATSTVTAFLFG